MREKLVAGLMEPMEVWAHAGRVARKPLARPIPVPPTVNDAPGETTAERVGAWKVVAANGASTSAEKRRVREGVGRKCPAISGETASARKAVVGRDVAAEVRLREVHQVVIPAGAPQVTRVAGAEVNLLLRPLKESVMGATAVVLPLKPRQQGQVRGEKETPQATVWPSVKRVTSAVHAQKRVPVMAKEGRETSAV
jgi:hypothetical protein